MADLALPRRPAPPPPRGSHRARALLRSTREPSPAGMSEVASGGSPTQAMVQSRRRGKTPRPLTPITTVSSPLNLGMNLSPRRISASLRGRNRHITLMLHSAGSAISGRGRRGHGDGVGGPAGQRHRGGREPTAARCRPPPAASQQIIASLHWTPRSSATGKESGVSAGPPCCGPGPPARSCAPSPPARDHEAGGLGDAQGAIPARLRPPGLRRAQPSCISTTALRHLQARPSAPPQHGDITAELRLTLGVSAAHPGTCSQPLYLQVGGQGLD